MIKTVATPLNLKLKNRVQLVCQIKALTFNLFTNLKTSHSGSLPGTKALDSPANWPNYVPL